MGARTENEADLALQQRKPFSVSYILFYLKSDFFHRFSLKEKRESIFIEYFLKASMYSNSVKQRDLG